VIKSVSFKILFNHRKK